jgi:YebC/PmpR family DNA-binding regulatory protein
MGRMFEVRKAKIFARGLKMAKAFTKVGKEIAIAVKLGGADKNGNPRLRMAIQTARSLNMPKDKIQGAIDRAASKDSANLEEISYEGYGPYGVAIFVETATDNTTRTVANVRSVFSKYGGSLATNGALDFLFTRKGVFTIATPEGDLDELELELIDYGLEDIFQTEEGLQIYCQFTDFGTMQKFLESKDVEIKSAILQRIPLTSIELNAEQQAEIEKLCGILEEDDDVQQVYHTMKVSE